MKKLGWYAVSGVVVGLILFGGCLLLANLYVQSRAVQQRIRQGLAASLRMPVVLRKTTYTPWEGLRIDGIRARPERDPSDAGPGDKEATYLQARSFRVRFGLAALLGRRFVVEDVLLDQPNLSWAQNEDSRWRLPSDKPVSTKAGKNPKGSVEATPAAQKPEPQPTAGRVAGSSADETPASGAELALPSATPPKPTTPRVVIQTVRVRHGSMDFLNHRRGLLGRFEEVSLDGRMSDLDHASGTVSFERGLLPRVGLRLERVHTGFTYGREEGITLRDASATVASGRLQASGHIQSGDAGTPFEAQCRMENVDLDQLIKEAGGKLGRAGGRLQGTLNVSGSTNDPNRALASGDLQLIDGEIHNFSFFQTLGAALRIDDLRHLQFKTARLVYKVEGTSVQIQPLTLASNNLQLVARGSYLMDEDRLDLHARLTVDAAVSRQLPRFVVEQFSLTGDELPGGRYVEFDIAGPLNKPTSNLYQRMVPDTLNGLLDRLLAPRPKRGKDKILKPKEPPPAPSPVEDS